MNTHRKPRQRLAFTLIEMCAVCALTSAVMALVAASLLRIYRVDRQVRDELRLIDVFADLGKRMRADAHAATRVVPTNQGTNFVIADGATIEYRVTEKFVERMVRRGDAVLHRDTFRIPRGFAAQLTSDESAASPPRVSLTVTRRTAESSSASSPSSPPEVFRSEATVGLHGQRGQP